MLIRDDDVLDATHESGPEYSTSASQLEIEGYTLVRSVITIYVGDFNSFEIHSCLQILPMQCDLRASSVFLLFAADDLTFPLKDTLESVTEHF